MDRNRSKPSSDLLIREQETNKTSYAIINFMLPSKVLEDGYVDIWSSYPFIFFTQHSLHHRISGENWEQSFYSFGLWKFLFLLSPRLLESNSVSFLVMMIKHTMMHFAFSEFHCNCMSAIHYHHHPNHPPTPHWVAGQSSPVAIWFNCLVRLPPWLFHRLLWLYWV